MPLYIFRIRRQGGSDIGSDVGVPFQNDRDAVLEVVAIIRDLVEQKELDWQDCVLDVRLESGDKVAALSFQTAQPDPS